MVSRMTICRMVRSGASSRISDSTTCCHSRNAWLGRIVIAMPGSSPENVSVALQSEAERALPKSPGNDFLQRADSLGFSAHRPMRPFCRIPGKNVEMRPGLRLLHKALEEKRSRDGTGETVRRHIVHVGNP